jgi:DNA invertase Pin-like site-specific DNA recombinase
MALETTGTLVRAAQYVRMSTDHQQYSTANQSDAIRAYAVKRGMEIVRTYADEGKSGLSIERRNALKQLIDDVLTGKADFTTILVYDVSRWGRFQDTDESAYYEYICRRAGINVHYCVEQFENDGNPYSAIVKSIKRAMAGEYSRELSVKVFAAHARLVKLGYSQGGAPGYGLRRLLIDRTGTPKIGLKDGDRKNLATDRVVLIPGPPKEIETVRWIFEAFVRDGKSEREIAQALNHHGITAVHDRAWTSKSIRRVLRFERYIGNYIWNRASTKLAAGYVANAPEKWIRAEGFIEAIVARPLFAAAQEIIRERSRDLSQEEKLEPLRRLLRAHGFLNRSIIDGSADAPSVSSYHRWFGGLIPVYKLIGFTDYRERRLCRRPFRSSHPTTYNLCDDDLLELLRQPLQKYGYLRRKIIDETEGIPSAATYYNRFGSMARVYQLLSRFPEHPGNRPRNSPQRRVNAITYNLSDDHLLNLLRQLLRVHGFLTKEIIDKCKGMPHSATYVRRFGGMERIYQLVGYAPERRSTVASENRPKC